MKKILLTVLLFLGIPPYLLAQKPEQAVNSLNLKFSPMELSDPFTPGLRFGVEYIPNFLDYRYGFQLEYTHQVDIFSFYQQTVLDNNYHKLSGEFRYYLRHNQRSSVYAGLNVFHIDNSYREDYGWYESQDGGFYTFRNGQVNKNWLGVALLAGQAIHDKGFPLYVEYYGGIGFRTLFANYKVKNSVFVPEERIYEIFPSSPLNKYNANGTHTYFLFAFGVKLGYKF